MNSNNLCMHWQVVVNVNTPGDGIHFRRAGPRDQVPSFLNSSMNHLLHYYTIYNLGRSGHEVKRLFLVTIATRRVLTIMHILREVSVTFYQDLLLGWLVILFAWLQIYFKCEDVRACIVTCGGLCPGINTVIREIVCGLWTQYGVRDIYGIDVSKEAPCGCCCHVVKLFAAVW